ncbi:MAG: hypothetical protein F6K54_32690 [Okeania sp. SIO3B5]|uniref:hypothetical protein n=1 Tax=Okeania sp. SIO3B5 TaxID=2607811 RepID=UPI0013FF60FA|nr:hypothetical protein [Okeania sp. SIO3B5]NEO57420.1 hypothetical protein [Okeania sp. SIO3B5]
MSIIHRKKKLGGNQPKVDVDDISSFMFFLEESNLLLIPALGPSSPVGGPLLKQMMQGQINQYLRLFQHFGIETAERYRAVVEAPTYRDRPNLSKVYFALKNY